MPQDDSAKSDDQSDSKPLDPKRGSPGQRSTIHAATNVQSSVTPADYPDEDLEQQRRLNASREPRRS